MSVKTCPTFTAQIYVGLQEAYAGPVHALDEAEGICRNYCDKVGLGLTVTSTRFVYTGGAEPGVIVGLINYPRFPTSAAVVTSHAMCLAQMLRTAFKQERVSVVFPHETVMLGDP